MTQIPAFAHIQRQLWEVKDKEQTPAATRVPREHVLFDI